MKKIILALWNGIALGVLFVGILFLCYGLFSFGKMRDAVLTSIALVLVVILLIFIFYKSPVGMAKFLLIVWFGLITAIVIFFMLLLTDLIQYHLLANHIWMLYLISLAIIPIFVIFTRRKLVVSIVVMLIIFSLIIIFIVSQALMQENQVGTMVKYWKDKAIPGKVNEVFPKESRYSQCKEWFDKISTKDPALSRFCKEAGDFTGTAAQAFVTGTSLDEVIANNRIATNPEWNNVLALNAAGLEAMQKCEYLQWFNPRDYKSKPWEIPIPDLLTLLGWTKDIDVQTLLMAKNGQVDDAKALADNLYTAVEKIKIPGQLLITSLIGMAMEGINATQFLSIQALTHQQLSDQERKKIINYSKINSTWARTLFDSERYHVYKTLEQCTEDVTLEMKLEDESRPSSETLEMILASKIYHSSRTLRCALQKNYTKDTLSYMTEITEWMSRVPDFDKGTYSWHEAHSVLSNKKTFVFWAPNITNTYARIIKNVALWRLVLATDQVFLNCRNQGSLPDQIDTQNSAWPLDPFDDKPMRYRKVDDTSFIVYSIGLDEIDNQGQKLYITGPLTDEQQDIGVHMRIKPELLQKK